MNQAPSRVLALILAIEHVLRLRWKPEVTVSTHIQSDQQFTDVLIRQETRS